MIKPILFIFTIFVLSGCVGKHGVSATYYNECKEYYDLQGYYHKECDNDDIVTYEAIGKSAQKVIDDVTGKETKPKGNVW